MIEVLTFSTIVATALFGVFGSLVDFRDRNNRVTRDGWIGLIGVLVAGVSAASLQVYSDVQEKKDTLALLEKSNNILIEVDRTLHPLPGLSISFSLRPDWDKSGFREVFDEIEASVDLKDSFGTAIIGHKDGVGATIIRPEDKPLIARTVCEIDLELLFFVEPTEASKFVYDLENVGEDLRITTSNPCNLAAMFGKFDHIKNPDVRKTLERIQFSFYREFGWHHVLRGRKLQRLELVVNAKEVDSTSDQWRSNSKITSLHDLLGAQVIVQLVASSVVEKDILDYRRSVALADLNIRLPNGIVMQFDEDNLEQLSGTDGLRTYSYIFPKTMDGLIEETAYDRFKKARQ